MSAASYTQSSFIGGEVSKSVQGQFENKLYRTWMNRCRNGMPMEQNAWTRRPGTQFLRTTRNGAAGRVISFDFKRASPYTMEFTDGHLRFRAGPALVMTNDQQVIVSISTANPAKVLTASAHGYASGDQVIFYALGNDDPLLQNRVFSITVTSATEFTIADPITAATIDGATLGAFSAGNTIRVLDLVTPYVSETWLTLRSIQSDIPIIGGTTPGAVLLHSSIKPYVLEVTSPPTFGLFASFSLVPAVFKDGPYFDPVSSGALITPSAKIGVITLTLSFQPYDATVAYQAGDFVTSVGIGYRSLVDANLNNVPAASPLFWQVATPGAAVGPNGFTASDIGRMIRLFSEPLMWTIGTVYVTGNFVKYNGVYYKAIAGSTASATNTPDTSPTIWTIFPSAAIWTWGKITAITTTGLISGTLAGSLNFGDMTLGGGLAAAFDGNVSKGMISCASASHIFPPFPAYIGKDYTAPGAQVISSAVVYPSIDHGFSGISIATAWTINLRAKHTLPANSADGTLLGSIAVPNAFSTLPVTIVSSDQTTAWEFVWIECTSTQSLVSEIAQVQFYTAAAAAGSVATFQIIGPALLYTTDIRIWRMGLYSDTTGWPRCGTYHEGRLWLSGVIDNRIDSSKSNDIFNFAPTNSDGSVPGNSAISYIFNAPDVNPIFWMDPDELGIVCGTQAGEWVVRATNNNLPLTPITIQAHRVTKYNCANVLPTKTNLTLAVVQAFKRELLEYFADVFSGKFTAQDLAVRAKHIVGTGIQEICYQQELVPIIWSRLGDGSFAGMTYSRNSIVSSDAPEAMGWHPHTLGSGRTVESICIGADETGTLDTLVMVTNDGNVRHVEMLRNVFLETDDLVNAWFLDDALIPSSFVSTAVPSTGAPYGGMTMNGLWHLNDKTVQVFAAGLDCGIGERGVISDFLVTDGAVFVPYGDGVSAGSGAGMFTEDFAAVAAAAFQVVVGFTYTSDGQIVRPNAPAESGARNGPAFGKLRRNQQYAVLVNQTAGLTIGTDFDHLDAVKFNAPGSGMAMAVGATFSGVFRDALQGDDDFDGMVCWRITRPLPATIAAIGAFIHTSDI